MALSDKGKKEWSKKLEKEGLNNVRIKLSQGEYNNEGSYLLSYIRVWIKNEEEKRLLLPSRRSNIIAISAAIISLLSLIANIILTAWKK